MNSREALNNIQYMLQRTNNLVFYKEETEVIKKDLEILELIKKHSSIIKIYSNVDKLGERFVCEISFNDKQYVEKLKEWLENE